MLAVQGPKTPKTACFLLLKHSTDSLHLQFGPEWLSTAVAEPQQAEAQVAGDLVEEVEAEIGESRRVEDEVEEASEVVGERPYLTVPD